MCLRLLNLIGVSKVIYIGYINEVIRLCFGGALLFALFSKRVSFFEKSEKFKKVSFPNDALPTLKVGRSVTRLTVYWALPFWRSSIVRTDFRKVDIFGKR